MTPEEAKEYYTYVNDGSPFWHIKTPPPRIPSLDEELKNLAGVNTFGDPILRFSWAGTLKSDVAFKDTLKYKKLWRGLVGFVYTDDNGVVQQIKHRDQAPEGKLVIAKYETRELGILRWVVEKWQSIEDAMRGGRFSDRKGEDGVRLFRDPPARGVYNAWLKIESSDRRYRALDRAVFEEVKRQWNWNENTSLEQKTLDLIEDERMAITHGRSAAANVWQN